MQAALHWLLEKDHSLFFLINNGLGEIPGLQYILGWPTFFGEAYVILPLCFLFLLIWDPKRWWKIMILIALAILVSHIVGSQIKHLLGRSRPYGYYFPTANASLVYIHIMFKRLVSNAFPSGHVTDITAATVALNFIYHHRLKWLYVLIPWVALTRIYVGAHYPLDTLGGFVTGSVVTSLFFIGMIKAGWLEKILKT